MKPSRLVIVLEKNVKKFTSPKRGLEQYRTPPEIAVEMTLMLKSLGCRVVIDLGTGTGMIAYASSMAGVYSIGMDIDSDALSDAASSPLRGESLVDFVQASVSFLPLRRLDEYYCVAENPPFGIHRRGVDALFLSASAELGVKYIASIHHGGSEKSIKYLRELMRERGYRLRYVEAFKFPIPAMYRSHTRRVYYVDAVLLLFEKQEGA